MTGKRTKKPLKISRRKFEIINIRAEIIEKDMKATIVKIKKIENLLFYKQNCQMFGQTHREKKREESNQQN